ncbi:hypothetical protein ACIOJD_09500 [Streptomyces sp. NPDC088116]|uniref:hypothetical protein n=1 Tax=Streptomyces sp. NPDC088116 TaxID=3365825 RepID=UPI003825C05A
MRVFPDQFPGWFGVRLATGGEAANLLFPEITPSAVSGVIDGGRTLSERDSMGGKTEDRYPDIFGLAHSIDGGGRTDVRATVADRLAALPRHSVILNHDVEAGAEFLHTLTAG